jgi:dTDP-4-dehydrorhamnose 3,5-epimerase
VASWFIFDGIGPIHGRRNTVSAPSATYCRPISMPPGAKLVEKDKFRGPCSGRSRHTSAKCADALPQSRLVVDVGQFVAGDGRSLTISFDRTASVNAGSSSENFMKFISTALPGSFVIDMEMFSDDRGFFTYSFDRSKFKDHGLPEHVVQSNISFNHKAGTLRGMHFQVAPKAQPKLVRCTAGAIHDVIVDLRPDSPAFLKSFGAELSADNHRSLFVPAGFAHGFQTLTDRAEVLYEMFEWYAPETARGVRFNDPAFGIAWPREVTSISDRDRTYPDFKPDLL